MPALDPKAIAARLNGEPEPEPTEFETALGVLVEFGVSYRERAAGIRTDKRLSLIGKEQALRALFDDMKPRMDRGVTEVRHRRDVRRQELKSKALGTPDGVTPREWREAVVAADAEADDALEAFYADALDMGDAIRVRAAGVSALKRCVGAPVPGPMVDHLATIANRVGDGLPKWDEAASAYYESARLSSDLRDEFELNATAAMIETPLELGRFHFGTSGEKQQMVDEDNAVRGVGGPGVTGSI